MASHIFCKGKGVKTTNMKIQKTIATFAAMAALTVTAVMPTMAATTFASATTLIDVLHYDQSTPGGLSVVSGTGQFTSTALPAFNDINDTLAFTGLQNNGAAFSDISGFFWNQILTGGTFTLTDEDTSTVLLSGTFSGADMGGLVLPGPGNKDASVSFFDVTYTGGTYFTAAQGLGYSNPGDLSLALLSDNPLTIVSTPDGSRFGSFDASGTGTFGATLNEQSTPEPGTVASFLIGALGLCALVLRGRKTFRTNGNIA